MFLKCAEIFGKQQQRGIYEMLFNYSRMYNNLNLEHKIFYLQFMCIDFLSIWKERKKLRKHLFMSNIIAYIFRRNEIIIYHFFSFFLIQQS